MTHIQTILIEMQENMAKALGTTVQELWQDNIIAHDNLQ
jgi:hypothetical protein